MSFQCEDDLCCPVCQDVFRDPVVLTCSHSFCKPCLQNWWKENPAQECPVCKRRSSRSEPPRNLSLKNLSDAFQSERYQWASAGSESLCVLHAEKLKLFCLDHQQPACLICRDAKSHAGHQFRPVHELALERKKELQEVLKPLQEKLKLFQNVKENFEQTARHIQIQAESTERQIREMFRKLHQFLADEEEARISAVREEEQQKSRSIKEKIQALSRETAALSLTVTSTEEKLRGEDVSFLQHYKAAVKTLQQRPLIDNPQLVLGALIDVSKHLGNLSFDIWNKMKDLVTYSPVILDPNTAHPEFILNEDLTSVSHGVRRQLPENPERTDFHRSVRGSEGFSSGTHSWDVDVGDNAAWFVGVASESIQNNGRVRSGFWQIEFFNGKYSARMLGAPSSLLRVKKKLQRVRVHVDWNRGKLVFFDPDSGAHIQTFTHTFTDRLFPCIGTLNQLPLKISPNKISVAAEHLS